MKQSVIETLLRIEEQMENIRMRIEACLESIRYYRRDIDMLEDAMARPGADIDDITSRLQVRYGDLQEANEHLTRLKATYSDLSESYADMYLV